MPNTAVKPANAESTWGEAPWEDRKPLIKRRSTSIMKCFFFYANNEIKITTDVEDDQTAAAEMMYRPL